jgi:hypothetical protein
MSGTSIGEPALVQNPMGHPPVAEQRACLPPGVLAVLQPEAEDEFERARR